MIGGMGKGETRNFACQAPLMGQHVFIVNNVADYLTLCEVQVFAYKGKY